MQLHIEELILHGLPYDQRHRVAAAVEQALARLLGEHGVPSGFEAAGAPPIDVGTIHVSPNLSAESMGLQVAQAIYGQIGGGGSESGSASAT